MQYIRRTSKDINSNFLKELLLDRGVINSSQDFQEKYFNPTIANEHNPELLDHMEEGYQLLIKHLKAGGSKIYICIDCDVDGFTSAATLYNYFDKVLKPIYNFEVEYHIPEGKEHGLQTLMPIFTKEKIADLIIVPDAGSNDYQEHKVLKDLGYDILVLDHHQANIFQNQFYIPYKNFVEIV